MEFVGLILFLFAVAIFFRFYIRQIKDKRKAGEIVEQKISDFLSHFFVLDSEKRFNKLIRAMIRRIRYSLKGIYFNGIHFLLCLKTKEFYKGTIVFLITNLIIAFTIYYLFLPDYEVVFNLYEYIIGMLPFTFFTAIFFKFIYFDKIFPYREDILAFFEKKYKNSKRSEHFKVDLFDFRIKEGLVSYVTGSFINNNYVYTSYKNNIRVFGNRRTASDRMVAIETIIQIEYDLDYLVDNSNIVTFKKLQTDLKIIGGDINISTCNFSLFLNRMKRNEKKAFIVMSQFVDICNSFIDAANKN